MEERGSEFSFFQGIHVRIDKRNDISIPISIVSNEANQADAGMSLLQDQITD